MLPIYYHLMYDIFPTIYYNNQSILAPERHDFQKDFAKLTPLRKKPSRVQITTNSVPKTHV